MAALTGVNPNDGGRRRTFAELEQQLPGTYDVRSFVSSHQVGIAKLALEFCDALVENAARCATPSSAAGFPFDQPRRGRVRGSGASATAVIDALSTDVRRRASPGQPTATRVRPVLDG